MVLPNKMFCTAVETNYSLKIKLHAIKLHAIKLHQILVLQCVKYMKNWANVAIHYKIVWFASDQLNRIVGFKNWQSPNKKLLCYNTFGCVINYLKNKEWYFYMQTSRIAYQQCMLNQKTKNKKVKPYVTFLRVGQRTHNLFRVLRTKWPLVIAPTEKICPYRYYIPTHYLNINGEELQNTFLAQQSY
jgi:hypothetical protein